MRHRLKTKHFGRDTKHRKHLLRNLVRSLVEHGEVETTEAKAKEVKRLSDKLIYRAKTDTLASRRRLHTFFGKRDVVNTLVDRVAPAMKDRVSGFSTIKKIGKRRGDNSKLVKLSLIEKDAHNLGLKAPKTEEKKPAKKVVKAKTKKSVKKAEK